jgi:hypothetical protein
VACTFADEALLSWFVSREGRLEYLKEIDVCIPERRMGPQKTKNDIPPFHIERFLLHCQRGVGGGEVRGVERRGGLPVCGGI